MAIFTFILANWEILSGIVIALGAWHKDYFMRKLNIRKGTAEAVTSEKGIDTVYIQNSEKLVEIYGKSMDDLLKRNNETILSIKVEHEKNLKTMQDKYDAERIKDKALDKQREDILSKTIQSEKDLSATVRSLKEEVKKLTTEVKKLTNQLNYYRKHSDVELPKELE